MWKGLIVSKYKLSKEQLKALSELRVDEQSFIGEMKSRMCVIVDSFKLEEIQEPLKKGDKVRFRDSKELPWDYGFLMRIDKEFSYSFVVRSAGRSIEFRYRLCEPYEWTEQDLRKQFEEATK